ncbi:MAG: hypothetical protein SGJ09_02275 [Phycisphaerae bacterium]|nr:hypothetical protein [Phycisphaerae bacterium]
MPTLVLEHGDRPGSSGILGETLREYGHKLRYVMVGAGEALPADLDDVDGIVATDGPQRLVDGAPRAVEFIAQAHARSLPIVGLGFGARLLAKALGGEIVAGTACGWHEVKLAYSGREDPMYTGVAWSSRQLVWQAETIAKLPPGMTAFAYANKVAGSSTAKPTICSSSAGVFAFGFEHRWELDGELFERQLASRAQDLSALGATADELRAGWREYGDTSMRIGRRMAESVALFLMPVERRSAGRVKDLHY